MLLFWWLEEMGCAMDKSFSGPQSPSLQFFWNSRLQTQSPGSLGSWRIPEVGGSPLQKSESDVQTLSPVALRCHFECRPVPAAGSQKNLGVPETLGAQVLLSPPSSHVFLVLLVDPQGPSGLA